MYPAAEALESQQHSFQVSYFEQIMPKQLLETK